MKCVSTTNSVTTTPVNQEMVPTPDILGDSCGVFSNSSNNNTIDDEFISFDINHIPRSPHSSIYDLYTLHGQPLDEEDPYKDDNVEQYVPLDQSRYPDDINRIMHVSPSSSNLRTRNHDCKYQKKKLGQHSCQRKPNKLNLITPFLDSQMYSNYHSVKL